MKDLTLESYNFKQIKKNKKKILTLVARWTAPSSLYRSVLSGNLSMTIVQRW